MIYTFVTRIILFFTFCAGSAAVSWRWSHDQKNISCLDRLVKLGHNLLFPSPMLGEWEGGGCMSKLGRFKNNLFDQNQTAFPDVWPMKTIVFITCLSLKHEHLSTRPLSVAKIVFVTTIMSHRMWEDFTENSEVGICKGMYLIGEIFIFCFRTVGVYSLTILTL